MVNVLYLHNSAEISGGEKSLLQLWSSLDRTKFNPIVVLPWEGSFSKAARNVEVDVVFHPIPSWRPWHIGSLVWAGWVLNRLAFQKNVGLIHSYTPRNNFLASLIARVSKIPVVWHERNLIFGKEWDISRALLPLAGMVICNSEAVSRRFDKNGQRPEKVKVVLNGVNIEYFRQRRSVDEAKRSLGLQGRQVVGIVSNLHSRKGVEVFLEIAALVACKIEDVSFVVVGGGYGGREGEQVSILKEKSRLLQLEGKVVFTGFQDDVRGYLEAFDVFCSVTEKEACSRAIIEAMAMEKAVVAFNDGGNPELIENGMTGCLVPLGDRQAFADAVCRILKDDEERRRMGTSARIKAEQCFNAKRNALETQSFYEQLLKEAA